jgi:hypothetical protein
VVKSWNVVVIESGLTLENRFYALHVLQEAVHLFEGAPVHAIVRERVSTVHHGAGVTSKRLDYYYGHRPNGAPDCAMDLIGWLESPRFAENCIMAELKLFEHDQGISTELDAGRGGFSIDAKATRPPKFLKSLGYTVIPGIAEVYGIDYVSYPAAGGKGLTPTGPLGLQEAVLRRHLDAGFAKLDATINETFARRRFRRQLNEMVSQYEATLARLA